MRQERIALLLLISVVIAVLSANLVLTYLGKQPFAHPFSEASPEGELVVFKGTVDQITITKEGEYAIVRVDNVSLFTYMKDVRALNLKKGDRIAVYGTVQAYHGKKEIIVKSEEDIQLLGSAADSQEYRR